MLDVTVKKNTNVGPERRILLSDTSPITASEGERAHVIETVMATDLSIDVLADKDCTLKVTRLPDGVTPGEASATVPIPANTALHFAYTEIMCRALSVLLTNTSGTDMTTLALHMCLKEG